MESKMRSLASGALVYMECNSRAPEVKAQFIFSIGLFFFFLTITSKLLKSALL